MAASLSPLGQMLFKHFSTAEYSAEQMHDKSLKLEQSEFFSTCETQANKQAGGVATTWGSDTAKATNAESFKPYMMIASVVVLFGGS